MSLWGRCHAERPCESCQTVIPVAAPVYVGIRADLFWCADCTHRRVGLLSSAVLDELPVRVVFRPRPAKVGFDWAKQAAGDTE